MSPPIIRGNRCKCSGCGELFNSVGVFEKHRVGDWVDRGRDRRCLSMSEMLAKGWIQNDIGCWIRGHRPIFSPARTPHAKEQRSSLTLAHGAAHG